MIELKVEYFVSSVLIKAEIWNNNLQKFSFCDMIFDTGASMTAISTRVARRSGYSLKNGEDILISGIGGGKVPAKRIIVHNFKLGGVELGPIAVDVVDFPEESNVSALLGMNIIKEFKVIADFKDKRPYPDGRDATIILEPTFNTSNIQPLENFTINDSRFGIWIAEKRNE